MKKTYTLTYFQDVNKNGFSCDYGTLKTAFYHLRECVRNNIYDCVVFRVNTSYHDENIPLETSTPILIYENSIVALCSGLSAIGKRAHKHYLTRFTNYLKKGA